MYTTVVLLLTILALKSQAFLSGSVNNCPWDHCYISFKSSTSGICLIITETRDCIQSATADCPRTADIPLLAFEAELSSLYSQKCIDDVTNDNNTTPLPSTPETTHPIIECDSQLLSLPDDTDLIEVKEILLPVTTPKDSLSNVLCTPHYYPTLRHCSLFSFSHLLSFGAEEFQTCSLPGAWYLLNHPDVTIEVTGVSDDVNSQFTKLEKVNITLQNAKCTLSSTINYVAMAADEQLPDKFSSDDTNKIKALDPIDFHVSEDGTIASILAPWLNLTIVVTKSNGYLSIVLRMPTDLIASAEGLCSNQCPSYTIQDIKTVKNGTCIHDVNSALYGCTINADISKALSLDSIHSLTIPFIHVCQFDVLYTLSYNALSFMRAMAIQYSILPNKAPLITPKPFDIDEIAPIVATKTSTTSSTSSIATSSTTTTTSHQTSTQQAMSTTGSAITTQYTTTPTNEGIYTLPSSSGTVMINRVLLISLLWLPMLLFLLYRV